MGGIELTLTFIPSPRHCARSDGPIPSLGVAASTRTRYARCGDADVAYQVLGEGPIDLLLLTGALIPIDCMDDEPSMARFQRRLSTFGRLLRFDGLGIGLSDRGSPSAPPTLEQRAQAAVAVLDAIGSERAAVLAMFLDSPLGLTLASRHPDRVSSLVVVSGSARLLWAPDYPDGFPQDLIDPLRLAVEPDAVERGYDALMTFAPSVGSDAAFPSLVRPGRQSGCHPCYGRSNAGGAP